MSNSFYDPSAPQALGNPIVPNVNVLVLDTETQQFQPVSLEAIKRIDRSYFYNTDGIEVEMTADTHRLFVAPQPRRSNLMIMCPAIENLEKYISK